MSKFVFLGIAAIANAIATAAMAHANTAPDIDDAPDNNTTGTEPARRRGRPPKSEATGDPATPAAATAPAGLSNEERLAKNQELIRPLVESGSGVQVKQVIAKYSSTGLKDIPADKQAAFEKDIEALTY